MRTDNIQEGIARQLKGRAHATGTFTSYESRVGRITVTSTCNQCGGPHSGISLANAGQAAQNPTIPLINCQHCVRVIAAPAKWTYEDVMRIPERNRTSDQDRIVLEHEFAVRKAEADRAKNAPIIAARAEVTRQHKSKMWDARERFLLSIAHAVGARFVNDPRVLQHESFITWEDWTALSDEARDNTNQLVDLYFAKYAVAGAN
jgi:hypothetical protein